MQGRTSDTIQVMIMGAQSRAARALLRWSATELADRSQISLSTIARIEASAGVPYTSTRTLAAIEAAFAAAGIEFIESGVRLKTG